MEQDPSYSASDSEDEAIVVTREEEEVDPEDEADFDREYAKIMAESFETRKFQPKQQVDIPLPVRPKNREAASGAEATESGPAAGPATPGVTMAFSLLTKRGNRQQVSSVGLKCSSVVADMRKTRTVELPSDSNFAVALINQRQAAKEEQQRIKNLVLNYDLRENEEHDGEEHLIPLNPNINIHHLSAGNDKAPSHHHLNRLDPRSGKDRGQRVRKLQLSDVDWYENPARWSLRAREQLPPAALGNRQRRNLWPTTREAAERSA